MAKIQLNWPIVDHKPTDNCQIIVQNCPKGARTCPYLTEGSFFPN